MSSTSRGGVREEQDFYETREQDAIEAVLSMRALLSASPVIFEPMAGRGALVRLMRKTWPESIIIGNEINEGRAASLKDAGCDGVLVGDLFRPTLTRELGSLIRAFTDAPLELCFTNPAFVFAQECVETCSKLSPHVKILQRTNFLHSQERLAFWQRHRADIELLAVRPHFAASLACIKTPFCGRHGLIRCGNPACLAADEERKACGWASIQYLDAPRPKDCQKCGNDVRCSTSDSIEYSWFHFWGGATNTFRHVGPKIAQQADLFI